MPFIAYLALIPVGSLFIIYTAFLALCTARSIQARDIEIPKLVMFVAKFWLFVGLPADVIFNWTVGAWTFGEWRGWTFSSHVQQRVDRGTWDHETKMWATFLNAGAPLHIKRVPA